ncbi:hypothetical protein [Ideonella dechloratans]|uniref:hypothetical protein n=1 Tax=Ideonella dechloratans TaxID=36863 RepID=UPI0035B17BC8
MATAGWTSRDFDPKKLQLDNQNPRIEVEEGATQDQIRLKLLDLEDALELARGIERNGGLFYGERIIVVEEANKFVVLEGNRRVAACQMLLDPSLVPSKYKTRFPQVSAATKRQIKQIAADVSPSRATAEPILTKRHTEQGAKPWSPVAKMRRAVRLLASHSIDQVAQVLGTSASQVKKLIKPYRLLKFALDLNCWTADERRVLEDEKLKTNPYTRFFTLQKTKEALKVHFDEDQNIISGLTSAKFKKEMERVARDFLLPDPANSGKPRCDTRTDPAVYFAELLTDAQPDGAGNGGAAGAAAAAAAKPTAGAQAAGKPAGTPAGAATQPQTPKASVFFENLQCHVQEDILIKLSSELRSINHIKMPVAASLLLRATFECALVYRIRKARKWGELMKQQKQGKQPGRDPALSDIIAFASVHANGVFLEQNMCKTLASGTTKAAKNYLDAMTHMKFQEADPQTLVSVANNIRAIIKYILDGN